MNTTTKASLGATVVLLGIALVVAVQNMSELKSARQAVEDRDAEISRLSDQLAHEREMNQKLVMRPQLPDTPAVAQVSSALEERFNALEMELQKKSKELADQELEKQLIVERVEKREVIREENLTDVQRKIRDAASIGEVTNVRGDLGFAVINAGKSKGIEPQMQFAIRRDVVIVGKVLVDSVQDANSAIVNIVQGSVQPGQEIKAGDTVIAFPIY